jgi:hypothetical protein
MSGLRLHWLAGDGQIACGLDRYLLAPSKAEITCLLCQHILAEPWHGTLGGYRNHRCHCAECTEANRLYQAEHRDRLSRREPPAHGTENAYSNYLCRCTLCRAAHTAGARTRRDARIERMEQFHVRKDSVKL